MLLELIGKPLKIMDMAADIIPVKHEVLCPTCRRALLLLGRI